MAGDIVGIADWSVLDILAEGERATLYRARRAAAGEDAPPAVLKLLRRETLYDEAETTAFRERTRAALRLSDQAPDGRIVRVYDVGEADGRPWAAMELVDGVPLRDLGPKSARGRLQPAAAVVVLLDVLAALDSAASASPGLAHGRLGPEHVILDSDGQARLVGFGAVHGPQADLLAVARLAQRLAATWPTSVDAWIDRLQHGDQAFESPAEAIAAFPLDAFEEHVEAHGRKTMARAVRRAQKAAGPAPDEPQPADGRGPDVHVEDGSSEAPEPMIVDRRDAVGRARASRGRGAGTPGAPGVEARDPEISAALRQARLVAWCCGGLILVAFAAELF